MWTELGPQGFLPQDPAQLRDELDSRGLKVCGGTVFAGLHKGKEALDKAITEFSQEAKLLSEVGAKYLIHLPEQYTDMHTGAATEAGELDPEGWSNLISGTNELGKIIYEKYGVELVSHPHADTHLDTQERILRFLDETDPHVRQPVPGHRSRRLLRRRQPARSSSRRPTGSPTCTSSSSTRRSANGSGRRSFRWPRPCRSA